MVNLVRHDLEFILKQIKIAEAHSAGTPLTEIRVNAQGDITTDPTAPLAVPTTLSPYGLRTVDGSYNNLVAGRDHWGAADNPFPRITDPYYRNENDDSITFGQGSGNEVVFTDGNYGEMGNPSAASRGLGGGTLVDADPRIISNLIVDQTLDNPAAIYAALSYAGITGPDLMTALNEIRGAKTALDAAVTGGVQATIDAAQATLDAALAKYEVEMDGKSVVIPNVSPDEGLSAPYNGWFTLFGQFFDHGLDLVPKGNNGTIYIPLQPDDPLYNPDSPHTNFMVLTRAPEGAVNLTTPWVDQNQTYTSHSSHQLFLREYEFSVDSNGDGIPDSHPISTGRLLTGDRGLATWADVKEQARTMLGINLTDADVTNIPLFVMDDYGEFVRGPNGYPQLVVSLGADGKFGGTGANADVFREGNPASPISTADALRTGHAFLDDIAHAAVPILVNGVLQQDGDSALGYKNADGTNGPVDPTRGTQLAYDNEMLDAHYITGDGRGNENIGLSAVHHVFHSEHNNMVEQVKARAIESGDLAFLNEWLRVDLPAGTALPPATDAAAVAAFAATLKWDGERLFQAARFTTEMQYQHLVFEEFARKAQPDVDAFVFNPSVDINPAIFAEFAHVVYRFGHSMLREQVASTDVNGNDTSMDLFDAFLNPLAFGSADIDHEEAAGAIVRGMTRQVGSEIDEFVTDVLRNQLVGIPLDLAALNIARGRDTGIPPLNEARRQFQEMANGDTQLAAYTSWTDFALNLKNPASIVNFIAAYGTHETITSAMTLEAKRNAAWNLVFGHASLNEDDRQAFLNGTGIYASKLGGLEDVDLWVGGMAEKKMAFGGMLGSTFSFIFELQMENLQNADRFYYLSRVQGLNFLNELENNSFAKMVLNNTDLGESGYALPGDIFSVPDHVLYMDRAMMTKFGHTDPTQTDPWLQAISPMVVRRDANGDGKDEYIRVTTNDHVLIQGTDGNDTIIAGGGDDSVWGRDGNDDIEAGYGVDRVHGGKGDDVITNNGTDIGEVDMLHGEEGNDVIHAGSGLALVFGNEGQDFLIAGPDGKEMFGGTGNDFMVGGEGGDFLLGNEGDDWIEGGNGFDVIAGDNSELNFNSTIIGHDVMFAGQNEQDFDAESGDDIMVQGESVMRNEGMFGYDWAIHKGNTEAADSDLLTPIFTTAEQDILRDRFDQVEALSGWKNDDLLKGDNRGDPNAEPPPAGANGDFTFTNNELTHAGIDRIAGLRALMGDLVAAKPTSGDLEKIVAFDQGNILLGGGGNDTIEGRGGNDFIDGDSWLNVRIRITVGNTIYTADGMTGKVYLESEYENGAPIGSAVAQFGGKTLDTLMLNRTLNPSQLSIVREIVEGDVENSANDYAVFNGARSGYAFNRNADGSYTVRDIDLTNGDTGTDRLLNIEYLRFTDQDVLIAQRAATGVPTLMGSENVITANTSGIADLNGLGAFRYRWEFSTNGGNTWNTIQGANQQSYVVPDSRIGQFIRVVVSFTDGAGNPESVTSEMTARIGSNNASDNYLGTIGSNLINGRGGNDTLSGLDGDDVINGGAGNDVITGMAGNDVLNGGSGNDNIDGGEGNDTIDGGSGTNTLNGGTGNDVFMYDIDVGGTSAINGGADTDTLSLFQNGNGSGTLNATFTTRLTQVEGATVGTDVERVVADLGGGNSDTLEYSTGSSGVTVDLGAGTASGFISIAGIENVRGGNAADTLIGNGSANILDGRGGADTLRGLGGDDTYVVDNAGDVVDETAAGSSGIDTVETSLASYTLTAGVENLEYTGNGAFTGTGNALNNVISGGGSGDNLFGLDGDDTLNGNGGNDTMDGGNGNDDLAGGSGNDAMSGGDGNDTLEGGTGVDRMTGGSGADTFVFNDDETGTNANRDVITDFVQGVDKIDIRTIDANRSLLSLLSDQDFNFIGSNNFSGNGAGQLRYSQVGGQTIIEGRSLNLFGNGTVAFQIALDGLVNLTAADFLGLTNSPQTVNAQVDLLAAQAPALAENAAGGTTVATLTSLAPEAAGMVTFSLRGPSSNLFEIQGSNVVLKHGAALDFESQRSHEVTVVAVASDGAVKEETFRFDVQNLSGSARGSSRSETLRGTGEEDRMWGGRGNDNVYSGDGNDQIYGEDGNDRLFAEDGNDHLYGGRGNDRLDGGRGVDKMWGGQGNDVYIVDDRSDRVYEARGQGIDTVKASTSYSLSGTNVERLILTGSEDTKGHGNTLDNVLTGNNGHNELKGGRGDDVLIGGRGNDKLSGGSGADIFVFQKNHGRDTVTDFRHGIDEIDLRRLPGVNDLSDISIQQAGHDTILKYGSDILVLKGVNASDLDSNDFIF
ncbi:peroxidase family protein [Microvirga guangxiensis]|uniref:Ca2+-binding protein, RTX toxin-related n=1 Tax=Microvirga guangxiensis TaxID=549386 RepID=A0A1G5KZ72_9HYPH|nr:peroxidase family protein [Microvirga guangxiensis]SCZ05370.1 Ca2+-binding protein, RTX toxin-related [Microvirga guangxiensis]